MPVESNKKSQIKKLTRNAAMQQELQPLLWDSVLNVLKLKLFSTKHFSIFSYSDHDPRDPNQI